MRPHAPHCLTAERQGAGHYIASRAHIVDLLSISQIRLLPSHDFSSDTRPPNQQKCLGAKRVRVVLLAMKLHKRHPLAIVFRV